MNESNQISTEPGHSIVQKHYYFEKLRRRETESTPDEHSASMPLAEELDVLAVKKGWNTVVKLALPASDMKRNSYTAALPINSKAVLDDALCRLTHRIEVPWQGMLPICSSLE